MKLMPSAIENHTFTLYDLEKKLKPLGYAIGGNWDYDHGYFDYKIDDDNGYHFLRIPFKAEDGQLDSNGVTVRLEQPFLLGHKYQVGLDDDVDTGLFSGTVNQFQEPQDEDSSISEKVLETGKTLVQELESVLLT